ncbi:hypothetical protein D915_011227 [Fasciola hepatica]|uniref:Uncharacterized protein n=1 Tax=Fasciola hepatica TaxID=6192 RepID=A0A4E0QT44_FASHE|nr:hypothetical protein D915_011227 [Fasciola hepatica]
MVRYLCETIHRTDYPIFFTIVNPFELTFYFFRTLFQLLNRLIRANSHGSSTTFHIDYFKTKISASKYKSHQNEKFFPYCENSLLGVIK